MCSFKNRFMFQTGSGSGRLLPNALPRQSLHEAAGDACDDDDAHKQRSGDSDNQRDEEEVDSWGKTQKEGGSVIFGHRENVKYIQCVQTGGKKHFQGNRHFMECF